MKPLALYIQCVGNIRIERIKDVYLQSYDNFCICGSIHLFLLFSFHAGKIAKRKSN